MGRERAWHGQGARGGFGLAASDRIPVAGAEQIDARYCLRFLRRIRDCSFATVDAEGLPAVRVIDVMHVEDGRLFFLAPRGKEFYREILRNPVVAIVGQTTDFRTCRLRGRAVRAADGEQKALVDRMFELNPSMDQLYPAESRYACEVFYIEDGSGEYFDLGQKPIVRVPFAIGRASLDAKGVFEVSEGARAAVYAPPSARKAASCVPKTGHLGSTRGHACVAGCAKRRARTARYFVPQGARMAGRERIGHPRGARRLPRIGREDLP